MLRLKIKKCDLQNKKMIIQSYMVIYNTTLFDSK